MRAETPIAAMSVAMDRHGPDALRRRYAQSRDVSTPPSLAYDLGDKTKLRDVCGRSAVGWPCPQGALAQTPHSAFPGMALYLPPAPSHMHLAINHLHLTTCTWPLTTYTLPHAPIHLHLAPAQYIHLRIACACMLVHPMWTRPLPVPAAVHDTSIPTAPLPPRQPAPCPLPLNVAPHDLPPAHGSLSPCPLPLNAAPCGLPPAQGLLLAPLPPRQPRVRGEVRAAHRREERRHQRALRAVRM